jgi:hypothetical protein
MKIFLRNRKSRLYYAGRQQWVPDVENAMVFACGEAARRLVGADKVWEAVELYYWFGDPAYDFVLPCTIQPPIPEHRISRF